MDLPTTSVLYNDAIAASKFADERLEQRTRDDYAGSLRRFSTFCIESGYPNPVACRFVELPAVIAAYINRLATADTSQWPAEKLRAALAWHYSRPEMLVGGHPHDRWIVKRDDSGEQTAWGNPARCAMISQILIGLNKSKKRERTPVRASPMSLPKLTQLIDFLHVDERFNETMRLWLCAVCSLSFYGMCRINEVLQMKKGDVRFGLRRASQADRGVVEYGCFTIRDRKTDRDPHASRTYSLHCLPEAERGADAYTHVSRWFKYASTTLHHTWVREEFAFPGLTKVPRGMIKKQRVGTCQPTAESFSKVGVRWNTPMTDNNFTQVLNVVATMSGIGEDILGESIWFKSHCFRRGGAQCRFMFAPSEDRWSLKQVKWWAGWSPNEQSKTVVKYLLDDVHDREERELGDALAPDVRTRADRRCRNNDSISQQEVPNAVFEEYALSDLKADIIDSVRDIIMGSTIQRPMPASDTHHDRSDAMIPEEIDTTSLTSELPDAKTWRDYVQQYWTSDPQRHQYRAGVDMLPHERKVHRSRLSRMKIIAECMREHFNDDFECFETEMVSRIGGELTANKILACIRAQKKQCTEP